jgi:nucleoside 2-deoxyribosyltransferase
MSKQKNFFISSKWRNKEKVEELTKKLRNLGCEVISFLEYPINKEVVKEDPEEAMRKWEAMTDWEKNDRVKQIAEIDKESINKADTLILLLPAGISSHLEAGFARGLGKECILIGKPEKPESGYLMIFDRMFETIEDFLKSYEYS